MTIVAILQSFAISLGVGSSTLAILNFFVAIKDGNIDATERRMMGVVYIVLRIAMVAILITSVLLIAYDYSVAGLASLSTFDGVLLTVVGMLFLNASLMSAHVIPSTLGPAIQAGSWYTLGTLLALLSLNLTDFVFWQFLLAYVVWIALAIAIVNGVMAILKSQKG